MRIEQFLRENAARLVGKAAVVDGASRLSYGDLDLYSDRLAGAFGAQGIAAGDRVVLLAENSWQAAVTVFAAFKIGAVIVPVPSALDCRRLTAVLNRVGAAGFVADGRCAKVAARAMADSPSIRLTVAIGTQGAPAVDGLLRFEDAIAGAPETAPLPEAAGDLAAILVSPDGADASAGVVVTHASLAAAIARIAGTFGPAEGDTIFGALALSHWAGFAELLSAVAVGATLVMAPATMPAGQALEVLASERATMLWLSPSYGAGLLAAPAFGPGTLPHLTRIVQTSPPVGDLLTGLTSRFPAASVMAVYGAPECFAALLFPGARAEPHSTPLARPVAGVDVFVSDEAGRPLAPGVVGELVVAGPEVAVAYWADAAATERLLPLSPEGVRSFRSGDYFRSGENGLFEWAGRRDDLVRIDGEIAAPCAVEAVLHALPGVSEAAALAFRDPVLGHAFRAVVALHPGTVLGAGEIIAHCAHHLRSALVPRLVEFRPCLPKDAGGIVNRLSLEEEGKEAAE
jgi:acyl-CoA synthetase (AMP-forming)/AMP-acid ligase II